MPFSVMEKVLELRQELRMRNRVYSRQVGQGQMTVNQARRQTAIMEEILADYEAQLAKTGGEQGELI